MQQRKIIIFIIILFIASSVWLFHQNAKLTDPNTGSAWWVLSFANPKNDSLDFTIENHSDSKSFHWEILSNDQILKEGDAKIEKGNMSNIQTSTLPSQISGRIIIQVDSGSEKKEIYKNL
jgi:hypothetical protein